MRILYTAHQFLPEHSSGTEILTYQTARHFRSLGHEVAVFTGFPVSIPLEDSARFDSYEYDGIHVERFLHASVPMGGQFNVVEAEYNNLFAARHLRKYVAEFQPDIVHFYHLGRLSASAIDACADVGIPMVFTATDFWPVCPMNQLRMPDHSPCTGPDMTGVNCLRHITTLTQPAAASSILARIPDSMVSLLLRAAAGGFLPNRWLIPHVQALYKRPAFLMDRFNKVQQVIVSTRLMRQILEQNGLKREKIRHIPFGIDYTHIPRRTRTRTRHTLRLGFIGTLSEHKGPHIAIQAVRALPGNLPVELSVYGDPNTFPSYSEELRCLASDDPRIVFAGTFPNWRVGEVLDSLDALLVPSLWHENTPLVIHSAQAAGCPVVASDHAGISEVVQHGQNGLIFKPGNVTELAAHIEQLTSDHNLLPKLSAQALIPKSSSEYAAELLNIYNAILASRIQPAGCAP